MTTADYLNQLETDRQTLITNLETKGITGLSGDETFTELVPEVLNIPSGDIGEYFNNTPSSISNSTEWVKNNFIIKAPDLIIPDNVTSLNSLCKNASIIPKVICGNNVTSMNTMYGSTQQVSSVDLTGLDTSNVTDMAYMFQFGGIDNFVCPSSWNTSKVQYTEGFFSNSSGLQTADFTNFNFEKVETFRYFFNNCYSLRTITFPSNPDTSSVLRTDDMFSSCRYVTSFPLFDTSNVTNMTRMFSNCSSLIIAPNYNTNKVENFGNMFYGCTNLTTVPIYDTSSATNFGNMFYNCNSLTSSLNNILKMCINATSYTGTKTLYTLFGQNKSSIYPASTIESLSNYQDFIDAGWTIGY